MLLPPHLPSPICNYSVGLLAQPRVAALFKRTPLAGRSAFRAEQYLISRYMHHYQRRGVDGGKIICCYIHDL